MGRLLCFIGLHKWLCWERWEPSMDAPIVTSCQMGATCERCARKRIDIDYTYEGAV